MNVISSPTLVASNEMMIVKVIEPISRSSSTWVRTRHVRAVRHGRRRTASTRPT